MPIDLGKLHPIWCMGADGAGSRLRRRATRRDGNGVVVAGDKQRWERLAILKWCDPLMVLVTKVGVVSAGAVGAAEEGHDATISGKGHPTEVAGGMRRGHPCRHDRLPSAVR
ncbi:hypothetical protein ABZP36_027078 [Zizania latifolia]